MKARIITIGDEILIGQIVDTNSAWIAARLNRTGIVVEGKLSVGDNATAIRDAVENGLNLCDLVITTGGIGPTRDDITKNVVAGIFQSPLVVHGPSYEHIEKMLAARGVEFNELNRSQAMVPQDAQVLFNRNGTAPGMWFERNGKILVVLPGVPFEMEALMDEEVLPRLKRIVGDVGIVHRTLITSGIAESILAEKIALWEDKLPSYIKLAYLPSPNGVRLRLSAYDVDADKTTLEIEGLFAELESLIPEKVIGYGEQSVESLLAHIFTDKSLTLAVAESCTGGRISSRLTAIQGASTYFLCSVVCYSNHSKTTILGVNPTDIEHHGAVSATVAEQMALGVKRISGAHYAIATTGIAGPSGGSAAKPVGTVWIAVATPSGVRSKMFNLGNLREQNIERASTLAMNMLREEI